MSADGARKLFVGGLAETVSEADLRSIFEGAGFSVEYLALPRDRETGRLRGFAFVTLSSDEQAQKARNQLQGVDCGGRPLNLREFSQEPPKRGAPGERPKREEAPTLFLGKLPFEATQAQVEELFNSQGVGPIARLTLPVGPDGRPRGFGFATMSSDDQVEQAVAKLNGATLMGRQIVVSKAQPRGAGPRGGDGPRRPSAPSGQRYSDRSFGGDRGFSDRPSSPAQPSFDPFEASPSEPPLFPPQEGKGTGRRRESAKKDRRDKRKGATGGTEQADARGARKRRGGGANWHRWESDDD